MWSRALTPLLLLAFTGWIATPALASVECRAMSVRAACPPSCPHCKKAAPAAGPSLRQECCVVRAAPATPPAALQARQLQGTEAAVVTRPAVFLPVVARSTPREPPRLAAASPPLQLNRPLLR
ncbi:MAG: hypothetical protein ACJ8AT_02430 [Hyalangium sp.]|uniref:hypothetical protein n=1 Tax=Hyalangium sp. TaxID=2028555 RepID=UPI00389A3599